MKITFLGTGTSQGVPTIGCTCTVCQSLDYRDKRLRTSIHIEVDNTNLVIDTGPDFRQQVLRQRIERLDAVLFTHAHRDHTAGLDDVRGFNFLQNMDIPVYAVSSVLDQLKRDFAYIFESTYPGLPRLDLFDITGIFRIGETEIIPLPVMHHKLPVLGFRMGNFSYITDANHIPEDSLKHLQGTEVLVINALQKEKHISHFNLEEALHQVELIHPQRTYLTHLSHKMGLHAQIEQELPKNVFLAFDGLKISC